MGAVFYEWDVEIEDKKLSKTLMSNYILCLQIVANGETRDMFLDEQILVFSNEVL